LKAFHIKNRKETRIMENMIAVTKEDIEQALSEAIFARTYNFNLHSFGSGECTLMIPYQECCIERPGGIVAGAVFMTAADVAMWLAIMTMLGKSPMTVTTDLKTAFISSAKHEDVKCSANILKMGRSLIYGVAECTNMQNKLLTHHTVTYMRLSGAVNRTESGREGNSRAVCGDISLGRSCGPE